MNVCLLSQLVFNTHFSPNFTIISYKKWFWACVDFSNTAGLNLCDKPFYVRWLKMFRKKPVLFLVVGRMRPNCLA